MSEDWRRLTEEWGSKRKISLYLNCCQVDTPPEVVSSVWDHVSEFRSHVNKVVDFGAGDGRFALVKAYRKYIGYEIDKQRFETVMLPPNASIIHQCPFSADITDADLSIGNPPYVRNQYLPKGWREKVARILFERSRCCDVGIGQRLAVLLLAVPREYKTKWVGSVGRALRMGVQTCRAPPSRVYPEE